MTTNPCHMQRRRRPNPPTLGRRALLLILAAIAALTVTVAWAAPAPADVISAELVANGDAHAAKATDHLTLCERLTLANLGEGECEVRATLHLLDDDGGDAGTLVLRGAEATGSTHATPSDGRLATSVPIEIDATTLAGKRVSCSWEVLRDGATIARGGGIGDDAQEVRFPTLDARIATKDGAADACGEGTVRLVADVDCQNLVPERRYRVSATLVDAETGRACTTEDGRPISATREVVPKEDEASTQVELAFDGHPFLGRRVSAKVRVLHGKTEVATYKGEGPGSVGIPRIEVTTRLDGPPENQRITDEVRYQGLTPGQAYVLDGSVRDAETGAMPLVADGQSLDGAQATVEFTPDEPDGSVTLTFGIDASPLAGRALVTTETLSHREGGVPLATYDGTERDASVTLPSITSVAVGAHTGIAVEGAREDAGIRDVVSYHNLEPGVEYVVEGELHVMAEGEDEGVATSADGSPVTAEAMFVPTEPDGTVELSFGLDATGLAGRDLAPSERIMRDGDEVATHDARDGRPVSVPSLSATLTDARTGLHEATADGWTTLVAEVSYANLPLGTVCTATVSLLDASTMAPLIGQDGNEARASQAFEAEKQSGSVDLTIDVDTSQLAGHAIVASTSLFVGTTDVTGASVDWEGGVVRVPSVSSSAQDARTGTQVACAGRTTLTCTVSYAQLSPGTEHVVEVGLVDDRTNEAITYANGDAPSASASFTPQDASGSVELGIEVDTGALAGRTIATAATILRDGTEVAVERDPKAKGTPVRIPKASATCASAAFGDQEIPATDASQARVTVACDNLAPGLEYDLRCSLVDEESGQTVAEGTAEGRAPDETRFDAEFTYTLDARTLAGRRLTPQATVTLNGQEVATHDGRGDRAPALAVPALTPTLHAAGSDAREVSPSTDTRLIDTVAFENLTPGVEYVVTTEVVDAGTGRTAVAETRTEASPSAGTTPAGTGTNAQATDPFEGKPDGTTVLVSEDGAYHLSRDCAGAGGRLRQTTLGIARAAGKTPCATESKPASEGTTAATSSRTTASPKATVTREERPCAATVRFTPTEASGTIDVDLAIDATGLEGTRLAARETVTRDGHVVATRESTTDDGTVTVMAGTNGNGQGTDGSESMGQTGTGIAAFVLAGLGVAIAVLGTLVLRGMGDKGGDDGR